MNDRQAFDRLRLPSFRHLRVFQAVASSSNLSRAAAEMNMSQPAVTQAMARIEEWVGATLFQRSSKGTYLTREGKIFNDCVNRLFDRIMDLLETTILRDSSKRAVRVAASRLKASHINVLAVVASSYSFEDATLALGISRTTVQRTARELEAILGRQLYERGPHGIAVTNDTRELARALQRICQELREEMSEVTLQRDKSALRVFIGAQPLASRALLAVAINGVLSQYPEARIRIIEGSYQFLLQELRSGHIDLMFGGLQRPPKINDVIEEPLFEEPYCVVARAGHPLARRKTVKIADLLGVDWVLPGVGTQRRQAFERLFSTAGRLPNCSVETTSVTAQIAILATSDRVTLLTRTELTLEPQIRGFTVLPLKTSIARTADGVTMRSEWKPTPVQACVLDQLRDCVRKFGLVAANREVGPKVDVSWHDRSGRENHEDEGGAR